MTRNSSKTCKAFWVVKALQVHHKALNLSETISYWSMKLQKLVVAAIFGPEGQLVILCHIQVPGNTELLKHCH